LPISFQQPEPDTYSHGALQAYIEAAKMNQRQFSGGGGGGGGAPNLGSWGVGGVGGGGGGGGGGGNGTGIVNDPNEPLTFAENLRINKLNQGLSYVDQQLGDGTLTQAEAGDLKLQLRTQIDPLKQRQERAQVAIQQQQLQTMQANHAHQTAMDQTDTRMAALAGEDGIRRDQDDGNGGVLPPTQWDPHKRLWVPMPHTEGAAATRAETATQQRQRDEKEDTDFTNHLREVRKIVYGSGTTPGADLMTRDLPDLDHPGQTIRRKETREEAVNRLMVGDVGHSSLTSLQRQREERRATERINSDVDRDMRREASGRNGPVPPWTQSEEGRQDERWSRTQEQMRQRGIRGAAPAPQPIRPDVPRSELPRPQQTMMTEIDDIEQRLHASGRSSAPLARAYDLYLRYGGSDAMPPSQQRFFESTIGNYRRTLGIQRPPSPGQQEQQGTPAQRDAIRRFGVAVPEPPAAAQRPASSQGTSASGGRPLTRSDIDSERQTLQNPAF